MPPHYATYHNAKIPGSVVAKDGLHFASESISIFADISVLLGEVVTHGDPRFGCNPLLLVMADLADVANIDLQHWDPLQLLHCWLVVESHILMLLCSICNQQVGQSISSCALDLASGVAMLSIVETAVHRSQLYRSSALLADNSTGCNVDVQSKLLVQAAVEGTVYKIELTLLVLACCNLLLSYRIGQSGCLQQTHRLAHRSPLAQLAGCLHLLG